MRLSDLSAAERQDYERLPEPLRELLDAELAAGNEIAEVQHWHPAAPVGASFLLRDAVTTRARESAGELRFYDRNGSQYSGEFTVSPRHFFVLEPPRPAPPPPDMDAIRAAMRGPEFQPLPPESNLVKRFRASMEMDYEKWREGTGYDLKLLAEMGSEDREAMEAELLHRLHREGNWRDLEALEALDTPKAREALARARRHADYGVRAWALQREMDAAEPGAEKEFEEDVIRLIEGAKAMEGLTEAIDLAVQCSTKRVRRAVLHQARTGDSTTRVNMAGLLFCLMGKTEEIFDWTHRPFFLRFGDHNEQSDFRAAWTELREMLAEFERS
jgi:hypothetical protein